MSNEIPARLAAQYETLSAQRAQMETMKQNQALRGEAEHAKRTALRAKTHNSWRQMKGMQLFMNEIKHPGNKPFAIGIA